MLAWQALEDSGSDPCASSVRLAPRGVACRRGHLSGSCPCILTGLEGSTHPGPALAVGWGPSSSMGGSRRDPRGSCSAGGCRTGLRRQCCPRGCRTSRCHRGPRQRPRGPSSCFGLRWSCATFHRPGSHHCAPSKDIAHMPHPGFCCNPFYLWHYPGPCKCLDRLGSCHACRLPGPTQAPDPVGTAGSCWAPAPSPRNGRPARIAPAIGSGRPTLLAGPSARALLPAS
mmetsp:Transcript_117944/g.328622  ORF Transcript_117944/g.328622 Transcript_117944/m.328622 type:complete len:228 (+) Transcript_117944:438-1121(+)